MRWSFMGPFETINLNAPGGVMDYAARYGGTYRDIAHDSANNDWNSGLLERVQSELRASVPEADIEKRTQWRDKQLAALVKHRARNTRVGSRD